MNENERAIAVQPMELSTADILNRLKKIEDVQREAMKPKIDYGVIPGTGSKPTLFKAGAEKLCVLFRLDPQFETTKTEHSDGHITIESKCVIYHQVSGERLGGASAECSSREIKYAYRKGQRLCPACGKDTIMKSKRDPGWWCNTYRDGCGANFKADDPKITEQSIDRVANKDIADEFPTVRRMAEKRAMIAAVRLVTGASAIFDEPMPTMDSEDRKDDAPDTRQKPTDTITPEQWKALEAAATKTLGAEAKAWVVAALEGAGAKRGAQLTVVAYARLMEELLTMGRGEESQDIDSADTFQDGAREPGSDG